MSNICDANDGACVNRGADILRCGGTVVFPTETVYGLGALFNDEKAVARIFEIKRRPRFDPLIVHVPGREWLDELSAGMPSEVQTQVDLLVKAFWPGPLTVVVPRGDIVPGIVAAGLPTVAVRSPSHPVARRLIEKAGAPVAAPSANRFGCVSPADAAEAHRQLGEGPDLILDAGPAPVGVESTIVGFEKGKAVLLRPGGLPREEIEGILGPLGEAGSEAEISSPGRMPRHYAPDRPVTLVDDLEDVPQEQRSGTAALAYQNRPLEGYEVMEFLSDGGGLRQAACRLFAALSRLGRSGANRIYAERVPEEGLGLAIMDRLRRASHQE